MVSAEEVPSAEEALDLRIVQFDADDGFHSNPLLNNRKIFIFTSYGTRARVFSLSHGRSGVQFQIQASIYHFFKYPYITVYPFQAL